MAKYLKREELNLVYDDDLLPILEKLGLKDRFLGGEIACSLCGQPVTKENLYSFYLRNKEIRMVCERGVCVEDFQSNDTRST